MQQTITKLLTTLVLSAAMLNFSGLAQAGKTYSEDEFLNSFSGKTQKVISAKLGNPVKKELSVKPTGASAMMAKAGADDKKSKPVKVEMWYYKNIVTYAPKKTYKETEITFVNGRAMNIAFFNNR